MTPEEFSGLNALLGKQFLIETNAENAVEIDHSRLTAAMTMALGKVGVNQASLGVQSFDPEVQIAINRVQSIEQTAVATAALIYGLLHQTVQSCVETVERCMDRRPDRFAVFGYAHVPTFKKHQRKIDEAALPDGAVRLDRAEAIAQALVAAGYELIGLDHFALPDDSLARAQNAGRLHRNLKGYTTDPSDVLIEFGASAISGLPQGYIQNKIVLGRHAELVLQGELPTAKGYKLTADDRLRADLIERAPSGARRRRRHLHQRERHSARGRFALSGSDGRVGIRRSFELKRANLQLSCLRGSDLCRWRANAKTKPHAMIKDNMIKLHRTWMPFAVRSFDSERRRRLCASMRRATMILFLGTAAAVA